MRVGARVVTVAQTEIIHVSDTHLGTRQYGSEVPSEDFTAAFERAIGVAVERDVDAVVHTGNLFDRPQPTLPTVTRCAELLDPAGEHDIPVYGIVGNHERRPDEQWLDLFRRTNAVSRLGREPMVVGETALYGIDAIRPDDWQTADLTLAHPPPGVDCTILCMHQLLEPPGDEALAAYPVEEILDRVDVDLDGLALGGFYRPTSARVDGTDVWYAGATERFADDGAGVVQLLKIDDGALTRQQLELETRSRESPTITVEGSEGVGCLREVLDRGDLREAIAEIELVFDGGAVTANQVTRLVREVGVSGVDVDDGPGDAGSAGDDRAAEVLQTARNAVETAALLGIQRRSGRDPVPPAEVAGGGQSNRTDTNNEAPSRYHDRRT